VVFCTRSTTRLRHSIVNRVTASRGPSKPVSTLATGHSRTEASPREPSRYVLGAELASGGMGRVVDGTDTVLGRSVAVKQALRDDPESLRRFEREMTITARLEHPSIVPLYDAGHTDDGAPFYVMRRVSGKSLDELIRGARTVDQRLALLSHVLAAAQAIAHAHQRGVIHRDVKPNNILVGELGETVVIDWGLAKIIGDAEARAEYTHEVTSTETRAGSMLGTPGFMAPEQLLDPNVDERADVYALGATLYYLLSGKPTHAASNVADLVEAVRTPPMPIRELVPGVPPELSTICDTALANEPAARYRDAGAFADELQRFLTGQLVASHRYSTAQRFARFVRRNRVVVAVVGIAAVAVAVVSWWAIARVIAARDEAIGEREAARIARDREAERADDVTLAQARLLLDTNPTHAVALIKPLAKTRWRDVRTIAADARASGVAWRLPSIGKVRSIELTPDGVHAVVATWSGSIRLYDLNARSARTIVELGVSAAVACIDDNRIVTTSKRGIAIVDLATGEIHAVSSAPAANLRARGGAVMWVDGGGHAWRLAGDKPEPIAVAEPATLIEPSLDGKQALVAGNTKLWLVGRDKPLATGVTTAIAWDDSGDAFAAVVDGGIVAGKLGADLLRVPPRNPMSVTMSIAMVHHHVYTAGLDGIAIDGERPDGWETGNYTQGMFVAGGDLVVAGVSEGTLTVISERRRQWLLPPVTSLEHVATSARSHYVVAQYRSMLFLWDLDAFLPREVRAPEDGFEQIELPPHRVLAVYATGKPSDWIDLATGTRTPGPALRAPVYATAPEGGSNVLVTTLDGTATLLHPERPEIKPLATGVSAAVFVDDTHVAMSAGGELRIVDVATGVASPLAKAPEVTWLASAGDWLLGGRRDGTLVRVHRGPSPEVATRKIPARRGTSAQATLGADGRVWFVDGARIDCWRPDGTLATQAALADPITHIYGVDDRHLFARTETSDTYVVDLDEPNRYRPLLHLGPMFALAGGAVVGYHDTRRMSLGTPLSEAGVIVGELTSGASWRVARLIDHNDLLNLSADARYLFSQRQGSKLLIWPLGLPESPDDTAAMLERMTNATVDRSGALAWP
jgi:Protein kinase domain